MPDAILKHAIFPVLDAFTGCLRRYQFLERLQWDPEHAERWQNEKLRSLVAHAYSTVPFYRHSYDAHNISPSDIKSVDDLLKAPLVTKEELKRNFPKGTISSAISSRRMKLSRTSGSTGEMFDFYDDKNVRGYVIGSRLLFESWLGLKVGDRSVRLSFWDVPSRRLRLIGDLGIPAARWKGDTREVVQMIRSFRPASLCGMVTILSSFASRILRDGIDARMGLRGIVTSGERLLDNHRDIISRVFDSPVFDRYGLSEVAGYVAQECEVHKGLHMNGGLALAEVVRDGEVCGPGETGRLVVTNLHNYAMPFIRYDTGDLATVGDECSCGRAFPVLERIEGRSSDWVLTTSLPVSWAPFIAPLLTMNIRSVERFQFIQEEIGQLTLLVAPRSALTPTQFENLAKRVNSIHPLVKVNLEMVNSIESTPSGKHVLFKPLQLKDQVH